MGLRTALNRFGYKGIKGLAMKSLSVTSDGAVFSFVAHGQRWEEPAKKCTVCYGDGERMAERPIVDYANGGFLSDVNVTCEDCEGYGYVPDHGQEEE